MASGKAVGVGGAGQTTTLDDLIGVACQSCQLSLDSTACERVKKESPAPKSFRPEPLASDADGEPQASESGAAIGWTNARAVTFAVIARLINGQKTGVRVQVVQFLCGLLNRGLAPALPRKPTDGEVLGALCRVFYDECYVLNENDKCQLLKECAGEAMPDVLKLSQEERIHVTCAISASTGVSAVCVQTARLTAGAATAVSALSCEALQATVSGLSADVMGSQQDSASIAVADELRGMLEGSRQINARKGIGQPHSILRIPQVHGQMLRAVENLYQACRAEILTPALPLGKASAPAAVPSDRLCCEALSALHTTCAAALHSQERASALLGAFATATAAAQASSSGGRSIPPAVAASLAAQHAALATRTTEAQQRELDLQLRLRKVPAHTATGLEVPGVAACLELQAVLRLLRDFLALEALAALLLLWALEGNEPEDGAEVPGPAAEGKKKKKDKKDKAAGFGLGRGTALLRAWLVAAAAGSQGSREASVEGGMSALCLGEAAGDGADQLAALTAALDPAGPALAGQLADLRKIVESNQARRKPKIAKGARDFLPDQMAIRQMAFQRIEAVFKRHGAVTIDTPVFELRETLMGKYGEDSKLIYDLADQGGELLSLRYDLTVPFARYVALNNVGNIKRYHIGKVYRRDQPQMNRGRFREFFQCDFDVAGAYPTMVADAEVLRVLVEILGELRLGPYKVKLNHRKLLDAMMAHCGVPAYKFRPICSAIDKLDKEPWPEVRREMVEDKGLEPAAADAIGQYVVIAGEPEAVLDRLRAPECTLNQHPAAQAALEEMAVLFDYLRALDALQGISFDLSLARGLDYYTGVIYEAVLEGAHVGSIAAGGRYDGLIGMFSGKDIPAVGVSIGIERVFAILEHKLRERAALRSTVIRATETEVLVASIGKGLQKERMRISSELWRAGIRAEFGFKADPKMGDNLKGCFDDGIPFMVLFGEDELSQGVVKIKDIELDKDNEGTAVPRERLVEELQQRIRGKADTMMALLEADDQ